MSTASMSASGEPSPERRKPTMRPIMTDDEVEDRPQRSETADSTLKREDSNVAAEVAPELSVVSAAGTSSGSTSPSAASASTKSAAEAGKGKHVADGCAAGATEASEDVTSTLMDQFYELVQKTLASCASAGSATKTQLRQALVMQHNMLGSMYSSTAGLAGSAASRVQQAVRAALRQLQYVLGQVSYASDAAARACYNAVADLLRTITGRAAHNASTGKKSVLAGPEVSAPKAAEASSPAAVSDASLQTGEASLAMPQQAEGTPDSVTAAAASPAASASEAAPESPTKIAVPSLSVDAPEPATNESAQPSPQLQQQPPQGETPAAPSKPVHSHALNMRLTASERAAMGAPPLSGSADAAAKPSASTDIDAQSDVGASTNLDNMSVLSDWLYQDWKEYEGDELVLKGEAGNVGGMQELAFCGKSEPIGYIPASNLATNIKVKGSKKKKTGKKKQQG